MWPDGTRKIRLTAPFGEFDVLYNPGRRPADTAGPVVIYFHGNAELVEAQPMMLAPLVGAGCAFAAVEYPGYGSSDGRPKRSTISEAADLVYDLVTSLDGVDPENVFVMGRSIGTGPAAELSSRRKVSAVILQSPFSSASAVAWRSFGFPGFLVRDRFDVRKSLARFEGRVLIFHGRYDNIIRFSNSRRLEQVGPHVRLIEQDCAHNDCPESSDAYWAEILEFIENNRSPMSP
jgi:pimeloyl-ACP methyl ester carboxylesterase